MEAILRQGHQVLMVDHTPESAVAVGDVLAVGAYPVVAHRPIAADEKGAVAARGGVYRMIAGDAIDAEGDGGVDVYWNAAAGKVFALAEATEGDLHFGRTAPGQVAAAADATLDVIHEPNGSAAPGSGSGA